VPIGTVPDLSGAWITVDGKPKTLTWESTATPMIERRSKAFDYFTSSRRAAAYVADDRRKRMTGSSRARARPTWRSGASRHPKESFLYTRFERDLERNPEGYDVRFSLGEVESGVGGTRE